MADKRDDVTAEEVLRLHFEEGWDLTRIARHLRVARSTIQQRIRSTGRTPRGRTLPAIKKLDLEDLYVAGKLSAAEVARRLGASEHLVYRSLAEHGLTRSAGSQTNDPQFDRLRPGRSIRVAIPPGRDNYHANIHKKARVRGYKVSVRRIDAGTVSVTRLAPARPASERIGEIGHLYYKKKWRVRRIAEHLGVSRVQIYRLMRAAGFRLEDRGKRDPVRQISKEKLQRLYLEERMSVPAIAERLGVAVRDVARELDRHRIWPGARIPTRFDYRLQYLPLWGERVARTGRSEPTSKLLREAKWLNVRVAVRTAGGGGAYTIKRLPFPTRAVVDAMLNEGMYPTRIAKELRVDPKTIRHLFPGRREP